MLLKKLIQLHLEDLKFLFKRCALCVTKIYHYTFERGKFKRDFVLMNENSRQNAKTNIEKDFYKLMNNAHFGNDCRNNVNNATFEPIIDERNEISYIKNYYSLFESKVSNFVKSDLQQKFQQKNANIKNDDPFRNTKITSVKNQRSNDTNALECMKKKMKKKIKIKKGK